VSGAFAQGELLKDRYRLERLLGRGGMAAVWLGHDEVLERPVAVKVLADTLAADPEFAARFGREARTAARVNHPNLVGVFDYSDGEERPYLVMEFVSGEDLGQVLAGHGRVDCERLARELLGALEHIHTVGVLHRDDKPGNVLIDREGNAKLIDFGIAQPADATSLTRTGLILGTERYVAPEVMAGRAASPRSDLYSCGVVLRSCVEAGGGTPRLRGLVEWLTSEDPGARPASARQALAHLERPDPAPQEPTQAFSASAPVPELEAKPAPPALRGATSNRGVRQRWAAATAIAAVIAALVVLAIAAGGSGGGGSPGQAKKAQAAKHGEAAPDAKQTREATQTTAATPVSAPVAPEGDEPTRGAALNEEGFALIQAGDYTAAVPVLEESVRAFPPGTDDVDYAYALYNLGNALRLSGRPAEAVPVLERRLKIPDQTETVRQELEAARAEAGL
jgi:serine/threonine protein kinase